VAAWLARQVEQALASAELSVPQYRVLSLLDEGSAISSSLAEKLAVRPPSVTSVVDGLVARALVAREPVDGDRRRISLVLTPAGRQLLRAADEAADERLTSLLECLEDEADRRRALDDLEVWRRVMVARRQQAVVGAR
jgi:DNA-binding MarR family transcriptional regulator